MTEQTLRAALTDLLSQVQDGKEIRAYLDRFGSADQARFAVIKVGGSVLAEDLDQLAGGLSLLHTLGLTPIVVHGAGPQLDDAVAARGLDAGKKDGLRVTTPAIMRVVEQISLSVGASLTAAIRRHGGSAAPMPPTAVTARLLDEDAYGRVGEVVGLDVETITTLSQAGCIPILSCVATDDTGRTLNVNADAMARAIALAFKPLKIVFLTGAGGLLDDDGQVISAINLTAELDRLEAEGVVHSGMKLKLREIEKLLEPLPHETSVAITSAAGLVGELFTHGGRGTLVRRGEAVRVVDTKAQLDAPALKALVEEAFGRSLRARYLDDLALRRAYVASDYRAAAVVTHVNGVAVLDKFAVAKRARGSGLSHALWRMMTDDEPLVFWRSRQDNPFNGFYASKADGSVRMGKWSVFWAGQVSLREAEPIVAMVGGAAEDFADDDGDGHDAAMSVEVNPA